MADATWVRSRTQPASTEKPSDVIRAMGDVEPVADEIPEPSVIPRRFPPGDD